MNVWAIQKHLSIKLFLLELVHRFGEDTFYLDESIKHAQAVKIYLPDQAELNAYIYSFSQAEGHYGVDLYFPIIQHEIVGENEELTLDEVIAIVQTHFGLV